MSNLNHDFASLWHTFCNLLYKRWNGLEYKNLATFSNLLGLGGGGTRPPFVRGEVWTKRGKDTGQNGAVWQYPHYDIIMGNGGKLPKWLPLRLVYDSAYY